MRFSGLTAVTICSLLAASGVAQASQAENQAPAPNHSPTHNGQIPHQAAKPTVQCYTDKRFTYARTCGDSRRPNRAPAPTSPPQTNGK